MKRPLLSPNNNRDASDCVMTLESAPYKDQAQKEQAPPDFDPGRAVDEIGPGDQALFERIVSTELSEEQCEMVRNPPKAYPGQKELLAIHWHPEWVPQDLTAHRVSAMFPNRRTELIIPTQHNQLTEWGPYSGAEVDCYASGFNRKVQLLLHFKTGKLAEADVLRSILAHTFRYRTGQLFEFMDTITEDSLAHRLEQAVTATGASEDLVKFLRFYTIRLRRLIEINEAITPAFMIKNKLLNEFIDAQREKHPDVLVNRALLLLKAIKAIVKEHFSLKYFFRASEVIEEARSLGGGVVIPHPEQFWPILLAGYDVDGVEVWNPQSREYTEFLVRALSDQNKRLRPGRRDLLIFMGDDTHMSVKLKKPGMVDISKYEREIGLQPAWDDVAVQKSLSLANASRSRAIQEYKARLG